MKVSEVKGCVGCPLRDKYPERNFIPVKTGQSLRLQVGEAGGAEENIAMEPFVGASGNIQMSMNRKAGLNRDSLNIANTIFCTPPNNAYPTDESARKYCTAAEGADIVSHCYEHHLGPLLAARPWERIDAIGDKALRVLTGKTEGIMKWRGSPLPLAGEQKPRVIGVLHPMYLMRDQAMIYATVSDLQKGTQVPPQHYNLAPTIEDLEGFRATRFSMDIETNRFSGEVICVGLCDRPHHVMVVPFKGAFIPHLKRIFEQATEIINQNVVSFDIPMLARAGVRISKDCQLWDVMLLQHLLQPDLPHDLEFIASVWTQMVAWKHLKHAQFEYYNACDTDAAMQIYEAMMPWIRKYNLLDLYNYVQWPLALMCKGMSEVGIKTDPERKRAIRAKYLAERDELETLLPADLKPYDKAIRVRQKAPLGTLGKSGKPVKYVHIPGTTRVVPWNSPDRICTYIYETLGLPEQYHNKTKKLSTDKASLDRLFKLKLPADHKADLLHPGWRPSLDALRKINAIETMLGSFLKEEKVDDAPKRVHANFLPHGTATGRLSSSGPNMQNVPAKARFIYVPSHPDWCFVEADFASLENRLAAWYAGDADRLARLCTPGFNEHRWLTSRIFGIPECDITKDMREYKLGKNTNHGADGAMGPRKLSQTYNIPEKEAKELLTKWREINHKSFEWQERVGNEAAKEGILSNAFGRKRWFWTQSAYTEGIRFLPQSTGADVCYRSMLALCYEKIGWPTEKVLKVSSVLAPLPNPARVILQVHDSLLVECPSALVPEVAEAMRKAMTQEWPQLAGLSIPVDVKVGQPGASWAELHLYEEDLEDE